MSAGYAPAMRRFLPARLPVFVLALALAACDTAPPPPPGDAVFVEAAAAYQRGELDVAVAGLRSALEQGVSTPADAHTALGNALLDQDQLVEAAEQHRKALAIDPNHHRAWVNASLGALQVLRGDPFGAETSLRKAIALDDTVATAHANLAVALARQGKADEAEASLQAAVARGYPNEATIRTMFETE